MIRPGLEDDLHSFSLTEVVIADKVWYEEVSSGIIDIGAGTDMIVTMTLIMCTNKSPNVFSWASMSDTYTINVVGINITSASIKCIWMTTLVAIDLSTHLAVLEASNTIYRVLTHIY